MAGYGEKAETSTDDKLSFLKSYRNHFAGQEQFDT